MITNETLKTIKRRRSCRAFLPDPVARETLEAIVEAGLYAPSGGDQAWHFTVVQSADVLEALNRLAKRFAATCGLPWLEELGQSEDFHSVYHAPAVVLVAGDAQNVCAVADTAAATQNLLLAAESLGLGACWGYFVTQAFQTEEGKALRERLGIPEGYEVYTSVMLGLPAEAPAPAAPRKDGLVSFIS